MQASIPALYPAHKAKGDGGRRGDPRRGAGVGPRATLPVVCGGGGTQGDGGGRDETREVGAMRESEAGGAGVRGEEGDGAAGGWGRVGALGPRGRCV